MIQYNMSSQKIMMYHVTITYKENKYLQINLLRETADTHKNRFMNLDKSHRILIDITLFHLIWHQQLFCLVWQINWKSDRYKSGASLLEAKCHHKAQTCCRSHTSRGSIPSRLWAPSVKNKNHNPIAYLGLYFYTLSRFEVFKYNPVNYSDF